MIASLDAWFDRASQQALFGASALLLAASALRRSLLKTGLQIGYIASSGVNRIADWNGALY
jgi:hypothetical protein